MAEQDIDIIQLFEPGNEAALDTYLKLIHPADFAELLELVPVEHWEKLTTRLASDVMAEVLTDLDENQLETLGEVLETPRLIEIVDELETDDAADVLADLPDEKSAVILSSLDDKDEIEILLSYPEDSAGGIMQTELCRVRSGELVAGAIDAVRLARDKVDDVLEVYVVDEFDRIEGTLSLEDLVLADSETPISKIHQPLAISVTADVDQEEVAILFEKYDIKALPVVASDGTLLGRITFDDIHDVIIEEASEDIMAMAGASAEDLVYGGEFLSIALHRLPWIATSLVGTLIASVVALKLETVHGIIEPMILASFVPVVAAMSGNMGSQSAMIITRDFAIGKVDLGNLGPTILREILVGSMMGISAGLVVGLFGWAMHGHFSLGITLSIAMLCSMTVATFVGVVTPATFKKIGIDPAIAAGPLVTTGCDLIGITVYLLVALALLSS